MLRNFNACSLCYISLASFDLILYTFFMNDAIFLYTWVPHFTCLLVVRISHFTLYSSPWCLMPWCDDSILCRQASPFLWFHWFTSGHHISIREAIAPLAQVHFIHRYIMRDKEDIFGWMRDILHIAINIGQLVWIIDIGTELLSAFTFCSHRYCRLKAALQLRFLDRFPASY